MTKKKKTFESLKKQFQSFFRPFVRLQGKGENFHHAINCLNIQ